MTANARLTQSIHGPARGSRSDESARSANTSSSDDIPNEKTSRYRKPSQALCVADTHVRIAAITGAPHGAATSPDTSPMTRTPAYRPPSPIVAERSRQRCGIGTGTTSAIAPAESSITLAIANSSHGLVLIAPNSVPVSPAMTPSAAYADASPSTYVAASDIRLERCFAPAEPPTIDTVTGIIGYRHGVRLVSTPPTYTATSAAAG